MKYSELLNSNPSETDIKAFLADGNQIAVTIRIPKNLKEAAAEKAALSGMSLSAYMRTCLISDLSDEK